VYLLAEGGGFDFGHKYLLAEEEIGPAAFGDGSVSVACRLQVTAIILRFILRIILRWIGCFYGKFPVCTPLGAF